MNKLNAKQLFLPPPKWRTSNLIISLVIILTTSLFFQSKAQTSLKIQIQVKAALIFQIAKFVDWSVSHQTSMKFCFFSSDQKHTVSKALSTFEIQGELFVQGHQVIIEMLDSKKIATLNRYKRCSLIYFDHNSEPTLPAELITQLSKTVLTIGDQKTFMLNGGLSALLPEKGKFKLYINRSSYENSNIKIQSRLLKLARFFPK